MPYTSPADVTDGQTAPAAWGDSVKAATDFLANPPACRIYNSASINVPTATLTVLTFNSERFDTDSMHVLTPNPGRITFNTAGIYIVTGHVQFNNSSAAGYRYVDIFLNGSTAIGIHRQTAVVVDQTNITVTATYKMAATNWVELRAYQTSGGNLAVDTGNNSPEFSAVWVGLG
jgi:hypothetical protein